MNNKYLEFIDSGSAFLEHHGVKGMKWGVRRYQPYASAKKRYENKSLSKEERKAAKYKMKSAKKDYKTKYGKKVAELREKDMAARSKNPEKWKAERRALLQQLRDTTQKKYNPDKESRKTTKKAYNKAVGDGSLAASFIGQGLGGILGNLIFNVVNTGLNQREMSNAEIKQLISGKDMMEKLDLLAIK